MPTEQEKSLELEQQQKRATRLHRVLNNGYASLLAQQNIQGFQSYSFEEALDDQIEAIEGEGLPLRANLLERVNRIEQELKDVVAQLKSAPAEQFVDPNPDEDVQTEAE